MISRSNPAGDLEIYLGLGISGVPDPLLNPSGPLFSGIGLNQTEFPRAPVKPIEMRLKLKRAAAVGPDDFVHTVAELKPAILDRDGRLMPGNKSSVDKCDVGHASQPFPVGTTWIRNIRRSSAVNFHPMRFSNTNSCVPGNTPWNSNVR